MHIKFSLLILILSFTISCNRTNDELRNHLIFNDNIDTLQAALFRIITFMDSMPGIQENNGITRFYVIKDDFIHISGITKMKINDSLLIPGLSARSSREFIQLVLYLKKNFITSTYKSRFDFWFYDYRALNYPDYEDTRDIVLIRNIRDTIGLYVENKIIDHKNQLLLVAPKSQEEVLRNYNEIENKKKNKEN